MPWKGEKDPYKIWLSEIILQQTRVEQGIEYYNKFLAKFPTIDKLAVADEKVVFKLWEGLGYYSRCRNLIATARQIHETRDDVFPDRYDEILELKGIGPYTAAAIASFAFNRPYAVVDGNVFRVLARLFGITNAIDSTVGKKKFTELAHQLLDKKNPGLYNQAIMDFGATICKPVAPLCANCIFEKYCVAYNENKIPLLPVKEKKRSPTQRHFHFFLFQYKNKVALNQRLQKDIWQQLYELPIIETADISDSILAIETASNKGWLNKGDFINSISEGYKQKLTHQTIHASFITVSLSNIPASLKHFEWVAIGKLSEYSFPKVINDFLRIAL